jgi:hypothetical protein
MKEHITQTIFFYSLHKVLEPFVFVISLKSLRAHKQIRTVAAKSALDSPAYISSFAWLIYVPFEYDVPLLAVYYP